MVSACEDAERDITNTKHFISCFNKPNQILFPLIHRNSPTFPLNTSGKSKSHLYPATATALMRTPLIKTIYSRVLLFMARRAEALMEAPAVQFHLSLSQITSEWTVNKYV